MPLSLTITVETIGSTGRGMAFNPLDKYTLIVTSTTPLGSITMDACIRLANARNTMR